MLSEYPDVLTPRLTAQILGIGMNKMYELLGENIIRHLRIGRKIIIPKICLIDYLESVRYNDSVAGNLTVGERMYHDR